MDHQVTHKGLQVLSSTLNPWDIKNLRGCEEVMCLFLIPGQWAVA